MEAQIVAQDGVGDREIVKNTTKNEREQLIIEGTLHLFFLPLFK